MKTIMCILVFMLVHGRAVCDELYPISIFKDIAQDQNDYVNDDIEPPQGKSVVASPDVNWIINDIVVPYGFKKHKTKNEWESQPTFEGFLGTTKFNADGTNAEEFFKENNDWNTLKAKRTCLDLLYITAARYVLVTNILYEQSSAATFGKTSEAVFDTNIYAFTLEFALPFLFAKLPPAFVDGLEKKEDTVHFKMQELASAYYKVFKYDENNFFNTLVDGAKKVMGAAVPPVHLDKLNAWLKVFESLPVKLRVQDFSNGQALRTSHNAKYQELVGTMSKKGGYDETLLGTLARALMYAAEAYHTRGAIRHVVGGTQMKVVDMSPRSEKLSMNDLWVSMIENWGETNKEYSHCKTAPLVKCFLKMSKYMWRVFNAMRMINTRTAATGQSPPPIRFGQELGDPEALARMWLQYKKKGDTEIPSQIGPIKSFLTQFGCNQAVQNVNQPLPVACLTKMNDKVNDYNVKLAALAVVKPPKKGK
ncbi:hypothetical protein OS493_037760 [Desmophyllum pertusum]|uniref:Uncharacterized protein n=1 Tax=Desmophyllum pertusum TaxID=174260 RepID=A0A9X0D092_9CNID|nr:hypothetical protein OS493_037760 [Desmophyllum pertusum]